MAPPTKYTTELLEKAQEYLNTWETLNAVPTIAGLAVHLNIAKQTLYEWEKEKENGKDAIADVCARVRVMQEQVLIDKGLTKKYDNSLTKLMLMKHGYSDRQEVDHKSTDGSMSPTRIEIVAPDEIENDEKHQ